MAASPNRHFAQPDKFYFLASSVRSFCFLSWCQPNSLCKSPGFLLVAADADVAGALCWVFVPGAEPFAMTGGKDLPALLCEKSLCVACRAACCPAAFAPFLANAPKSGTKTGTEVVPTI